MTRHITNDVRSQVMNVVSDVLGGDMQLVGGVGNILHVEVQDPGPGGNSAAANNDHHLGLHGVSAH